MWGHFMGTDVISLQSELKRWGRLEVPDDAVREEEDEEEEDPVRRQQRTDLLFITCARYK